mmetsp:Transcript_16521/g.24100  ORF Transcript_16521/g.24100 Transcript_16521/m.24100 type:complete len:100 (-) Transcript_16521:128-427(-)
MVVHLKNKQIIAPASFFLLSSSSGTQSDSDSSSHRNVDDSERQHIESTAQMIGLIIKVPGSLKNGKFMIDWGGGKLLVVMRSFLLICYKRRLGRKRRKC